MNSTILNYNHLSFSTRFEISFSFFLCSPSNSAFFLFPSSPLHSPFYVSSLLFFNPYIILFHFRILFLIPQFTRPLSRESPFFAHSISLPFSNENTVLFQCINHLSYFQTQFHITAFIGPSRRVILNVFFHSIKTRLTHPLKCVIPNYFEQDFNSTFFLFISSHDRKLHWWYRYRVCCHLLWLKLHPYQEV